MSVTMLNIDFLHFCLLFDRTVDRQETKLEREREGTGSGKVREPGLEHGTPQSATALHVDTLPTRLSAPTPKCTFSRRLHLT